MFLLYCDRCDKRIVPMFEPAYDMARCGVVRGVLTDPLDDLEAAIEQRATFVFLCAPCGGMNDF